MVLVLPPPASRAPTRWPSDEPRSRHSSSPKLKGDGVLYITASGGSRPRLTG